MTADHNRRQAIAELMVDVHLMPLPLAAVRVSEMDEIEVAQRFETYTGLELSAERRTSKSDPDFYQVFGLATATARRSALNPEPVLPTETSLPELDEKTWSDSRAGR